MKKLIGLMMILAFALQSNAQYVVDNEPWCPPGATWIYRTFSPTSREYIKLEYVKDSVINQQNAKKLNVYTISYIGPGLPPDNGARIVNHIGSEYLYESNDSIYWYDKINTGFRFIYKFNPVVGEEFVVGNSRAMCQANNQYPSFDTVVVTTLYQDTLSNRIFNMYSTTYDSISLYNVINKIGPLGAPFPQIRKTFCNNSASEYNTNYEEFVCYMDTLRGSIQFSFQGDYGDCYGISTSINDEQKKLAPAYIVYPNPANNAIKIDVGYNEHLVLQIYNNTGYLVKEQLEFTGVSSVSELPTGMYTLRLTDRKGKSAYLKLIKQ